VRIATLQLDLLKLTTVISTKHLIINGSEGMSLKIQKLYVHVTSIRTITLLLSFLRKISLITLSDKEKSNLLEFIK
ncbi:MAG TPA: hypothetical protein VFD60_02120, partial [Nitrososphaeraceae archaeon]|nr:hypothetical protein [Nitrososphaeraceae archaeon]